MRTHLTLDEIKKYIDDTEESEEYLLWMETVSEHIDGCELCEKRIQKALITEAVLREEHMGDLLKLAQQEEEIRKNILINKPYNVLNGETTQKRSVVTSCEKNVLEYKHNEDRDI